MLRQQQLETWLKQCFPNTAFTLTKLAADAGKRQYFRLTRNKQASLIVMDAPPEHENTQLWVQVANLLRTKQLNVPEIFAQNFELGFLIISDFGDQNYLKVIKQENAAHLFADAIASLICLQQIAPPKFLPQYDSTKLITEMQLSVQWYIECHKHYQLTDEQNHQLMVCFQLLADNAVSQPQVLVHRDYMVRNLMYLPEQNNPGIIDFQDAVCGPITYDLASLLKDAFISWEEDFVLDMAIRYWQTALQCKLPIQADFAEFYRDFEWMSVQRHLKVLGIFSRLYYRDQRQHYLQDTPRFIDYLSKTCRRYQQLTPLLRVLEQVENTPIQYQYSF